MLVQMKNSEIEEQVKQSNSLTSFLQAEVSTLKTDRDKQNVNLSVSSHSALESRDSELKPGSALDTYLPVLNIG